MSMIDFRRRDVVDNIRYNPYWIKSPIIRWDGKEGFSEVLDDNEAVLFSFPKEVYGVKVRVHEVFWQVIEQFTISSGTVITMSLGSGTIPTEFHSDGSVVTEVDATEYVADMDEEAAAAWKAPISGLLDVITPADAAVPVVYLDTASDGVIDGGALQVYMQISEVW